MVNTDWQLGTLAALEITRKAVVRVCCSLSGFQIDKADPFVLQTFEINVPVILVDCDPTDWVLFKLFIFMPTN